jgi:hypothetical protein
VREKELLEIEFAMGMHLNLNAYHIGFLEFGEVLSLDRRLTEYNKERLERAKRG